MSQELGRQEKLMMLMEKRSSNKKVETQETQEQVKVCEKEGGGSNMYLCTIKKVV